MPTHTYVRSADTKPFKVKHVVITELEEVPVCQLEPLFPNGGWDVHHHIFEREFFASL